MAQKLELEQGGGEGRGWECEGKRSSEGLDEAGQSLEDTGAC